MDLKKAADISYYGHALIFSDALQGTEIFSRDDTVHFPGHTNIKKGHHLATLGSCLHHFLHTCDSPSVTGFDKLLFLAGCVYCLFCPLIAVVSFLDKKHFT